jgi:Cu+-exporting ATPase
MTLASVVAVPGWLDGDVLRLASAVEAGSEHPVGRAVAAAYDDALPALTEFSESAGYGVRGTVEGRLVEVGRPSGDLPAPLAAAVDAAQDAGRTAAVVRVDGAPAGVVVVADLVRPTSAEAVVALRRLGLAPVLLTGDSERTARAVAAEAGIEEVLAEVDPAGKVAAVRRLQEQGRVVAVVGDGVNDAAALAQADLGLAMGTGSDIAVQAADLTLVRADLLAAADAVRLSRATLGIIRTNLAWAFGYNVVALPLAAAGLLDPMIAGAAMAFSSVAVVTNSLRLRSFR